MKKYRILFCLAAVLMAGSCVSPDKITIEGVESVEWRGMGLSSAGMDVTLSVDNRSGGNVRILEGECTVFDEGGRPVVTIDLRDEVIAPRRSLSKVVFPLDIKFRMNILELAGMNQARLGKATVSGYVVVRGGAARKKIEFKDVDLARFAGMAGIDDFGRFLK